MICCLIIFFGIWKIKFFIEWRVLLLRKPVQDHHFFSWPLCPPLINDSNWIKITIVLSFLGYPFDEDFFQELYWPIGLVYFWDTTVVSRHCKLSQSGSLFFKHRQQKKKGKGKKGEQGKEQIHGQKIFSVWMIHLHKFYRCRKVKIYFLLGLKTIFINWPNYMAPFKLLSMPVAFMKFTRQKIDQLAIIFVLLAWGRFARA